MASPCCTLTGRTWTLENITMDIRTSYSPEWAQAQQKMAPVAKMVGFLPLNSPATGSIDNSSGKMSTSQAPRVLNQLTMADVIYKTFTSCLDGTLDSC